MKTIVLSSIHIENFKGIRKLDVRFSDRVTNIYGANATGKTTIFDAITWLLFDKNSENAKDFNIKPLSIAGETAQKGIEPTVCATITINGDPVELQKNYCEKWTKKRGSADAEFSGHETKYYIDQVPKKKSEYESYIAGIVDEKAFRLLTDALFFNTKLHWQDRRKLLMEVCGDVADADVVYQHPELKAIMEHLMKYSIDDYKKMIASQRTKLNKEREELPIRIDEAYKLIEDVDEKTERETVDKLTAQLTLTRAAAEIDSSAADMAKVNAEIAALRAENHAYISELQSEHARKASKSAMEIGKLQERADTAEAEISSLTRRCNDNEKQREALRQEFYIIRDETWHGNTTCPTCGQELPEEKIKAGIAGFNKSQSERKEKNKADGKRLAVEYEEMQSKIAELQKVVYDAHEEMKSIPAVSEFEPSDKPGFLARMRELNDRRTELSALSKESSAAEMDAKIAQLESDIYVHRTLLLKAENNKKQRARIAELEQREKALSAEIEYTDGQIHLTEEFTKAKVAMVESKINATFSAARFKLFDTQINGSVVDCCEVTCSGVPYADLNSAARINIGLDIINALVQHYGVSAPVVIDNAESVTDLIPTDGQMIRLVVSAEDKELRIA